MNFFNIYYTFIADHAIRDVKHATCELQHHHIIPKIIGGPKSDECNLVWLTADDHKVAHQILGLAFLSTKNHDAFRKMRYFFSYSGLKLLEKYEFLDMLKIQALSTRKRHKAKFNGNVIDVVAQIKKKCVWCTKDFMKCDNLQIAAKILNAIGSNSTYNDMVYFAS